ncbi:MULTISPECIES: hypothetical protein [Pseudomonas]|uniref:hypothetical protein n=1 Tax=Pseudomonas TaxID=286 RepID=UPI0003C384AF|nr:hypothetical protein [Pseudomonas aeruginosa]ESR70854.1 hypothetical protein T266_12795 [Pseudomonas aeruginosa VRFPA05]AUA70365.1 hypothetical protein CWI25_10170 [Pseudomonas aeruginosa]AUA94927.1 hypothetical protein CWI24_10355 [Pseudomonas aeruginosa]EJV1364921.1 hypothetical protein [Pseudomonas aeruginosa]EJV1383886.1 hypothetical protein [Pseudomonas aeruginosa]
MTREEAYAAVAKMAEEHALIYQAAGGVIVIVHPDTQREKSIEEMCLYMAGQGPHPATIEQRKQQGEQDTARRATAEQQLDIFNDSKESA